MQTLFEIKSDRVILRWNGVLRSPMRTSQSHGADDPRSADAQTPVGTLRVVPRRAGARLDVAPLGYPEYTVGPGHVAEGPPLYEESTYHVMLHPLSNARVELVCRDPGIINLSSNTPRGDLIATVNFRGQVGYSRFEVLVEGLPEFAFDVEVFPSKIDYKSDYDAMLAEISDFFTGLALEYLKATYRLGKPAQVPQPSDLEWLTVLRQVIGELERALRHIAQQPRRRLTRHQEYARLDKLRRVDSNVRRAILRGKGRGGNARFSLPGTSPDWSGRGLASASQIAVRQYLEAQRPVETLDTPEHRWLKTQILDIRSRVAGLLRDERERLSASRTKGSKRNEQTIAELEAIEARLTNLLKLEPLDEAKGEPPANFSSLLLQSAPGYREAYLTCLILRLGLRIEGGPLELSLKDISALYEYWCYLAVVRLVADELQAKVDPRDLLRVTSHGLKVDLESGRTKSITLGRNGGDETGPKRVSLTFQPSFDSPTGRQKPDVGLSISVGGWREPFELILDAKYRLDGSPLYVAQHGCPGPPEDAVNVLHRYRDAILVSLAPGQPRDKRAVIVGAALFPFQDPAGEYTQHTFFRSLDQVGIGALPFLPSQQEYVAGFLRELLRRSGWSLADKVLDHRTAMERASWMQEAAQPALIGVIRPGVGHLEWIIEHRLYYAPLARLGKRKFAARWVAIYQGKKDLGRAVGAVTHEAQVLGVEVVPRRKIKTPWAPSGSEDEWCVVYKLGEVREREHPITVEHGMRSFRWASRLSLSRARIGSELYLETEPEWHLYDELRAKGNAPIVKPGNPKVVDPEDPQGRAVFCLGPWRIQYAGAAGFRMSSQGTTVYEPTVSRVIERVMSAVSRPY